VKRKLWTDLEEISLDLEEGLNMQLGR